MKNFLRTNKKRLTLLLLITLIINIGVIRIFDSPLKNEVCKSGIVSFELANDLDTTISILDSWDVNAKNCASLSLGFDFLFILVYSSFIALLIFNINDRLWKNKSFHKLGSILIVLIFIAAFFDVIENIALIKLLLGNLEQVWSSVAYFSSVTKFAIILICIIYLFINWFLLLFKRN